MISTEQFKACFEANRHPAEWAEVLNQILPKYEITTEERLIAFLAQWGFETAGFTHLVENLNYSAAGLLATWPRRFNPETAAKHAHNPEAIANIAYAHRMGNDGPESGDGWLYRGRGCQLTGKLNYQAFARHLGKTITETIEYMLTKPGAVESGCWFWENNNLNLLADTNSVKATTRIINGGYNGLAERYELTEKIREVLKGKIK